MAVLARVMKVVLIIVVLVVLLLVLAAAALKAIDWSEHKGLVTGLVETFSDWNVERLGDIQIELFFPTEIRVEDFKLTQDSPDSSLQVLEGERFYISLDPLSALFAERLHIYDIQASATDVLARRTGEDVPASEDRALPYIEALALSDIDFLYKRPEMEARDLDVHIQQLTLSSPGRKDLITLAGEGSIWELPIELKGRIGSLKSLSEGEIPYPVDLEGQFAGDELAIEGHLLTRGEDQGFLINVAAEGNSLSQVAEVFGLDLYELPPYKLNVNISRFNSEIAATDIQATFGYSYIYGAISYDQGGDRPLLRADLGASLLRWDDLRRLFPEGEEEPPTPGQVFSREPLNLDALASLDAEVELVVGEYRDGKAGQYVSGLTLEAKLEDGRLIVNPFEVAFADGTLGGGLLIEQQDGAAEVRANLAARRVDLANLLAPFLDGKGPERPRQWVRGEITGNLEAITHGGTPHELASRVNGNLTLAIEDGAVTATLVEALGFDLTETVVSWFADHPLTDIRCGVGTFDINSGVIETQSLLLATNDSNVIGQGQVNLQQETLNLRFESHARDFSIFALETPIQIQGPLENPQVDLVSTEMVAKLAASTVATLVQPALAVLPLLEVGVVEQGRCSNWSRELRVIQRNSRRELAP